MDEAKKILTTGKSSQASFLSILSLIILKNRALLNSFLAADLFFHPGFLFAVELRLRLKILRVISGWQSGLFFVIKKFFSN